MGGFSARLCRIAALGIVMYLGAVSAAHADLAVWFGGESFRWREYDAGGGELLEEAGPRFRVGADWSMQIFGETQTRLEVRGSLYLGRVGYDGQACTLGFPQVCTPFDSDTDYYGADVAATVARRFGGSSGGELFAGGGIDNWRRAIKGRGSVSGAIEDWTTFYVVAGGGGYWNGASVRHSARIGMKFPFYTEEYPDTYDVVLNPEGRPAVFARITSDFLSEGRPRWGIGAYFDRYRFDVSDREQDGSVLVWQPESHQDVVGLFATVYIR